MNALEELRSWTERRISFGTSLNEMIDIIGRFEREWIECPKDKDGAPIRPGETLVLQGDKLLVSSVNSSEWMDCYDRVHDACDWSHMQPDSWESIKEDIKKSACSYFHVPYACLACSHTSGNCAEDMAREIVRRCKKLAGVE